MSFSKELWGSNIWYLFHSLIYKIKEDKFNDAKNDLIYVIKNISANLPCPECSSHAQELLNKVDFNKINNKNEFKTMLFNFHNVINKKLNKPLFNIDNLDTKYNNCNIDVCYNNFKIIFSSNSNIPQLMSNSFHRKQQLPLIMQKLVALKQFM